MAIPDASWAALDAPAKRERILDAARELFAREGVDAPMPALAAAVGVGVGSVYRCFPSKQDLIAALVVARYDEVAELAREALAAAGDDAFASLCALLWELAERQASDDLMGWAGELVADEPIVRRRRTLVSAILDELLDLARAQGRLRADASSRDIHLLFAATRAARSVDADGWRRVLVLLIDSLRDQ
jgi:AcrR family transcriptional regulator